jgi:prophage regulatory protein
MANDYPKTVTAVLRPAVIDEDQAAAYLSLSVSTITKMERKGEFPKKRQLAGRRVGYLLREIDEWLEARPVSNQLPPFNSEFGRAGKPDKQKPNIKD